MKKRSYGEYTEEYLGERGKSPARPAFGYARPTSGGASIPNSFQSGPMAVNIMSDSRKTIK